jgi:hypothetical protein
MSHADAIVAWPYRLLLTRADHVQQQLAKSPSEITTPASGTTPISPEPTFPPSPQKHTRKPHPPVPSNVPTSAAPAQLSTTPAPQSKSARPVELPMFAEEQSAPSPFQEPISDPASNPPKAASIPPATPPPVRGAIGITPYQPFSTEPPPQSRGSFLHPHSNSSSLHGLSAVSGSVRGERRSAVAALFQTPATAAAAAKAPTRIHGDQAVVRVPPILSRDAFLAATRCSMHSSPSGTPQPSPPPPHRSNLTTHSAHSAHSLPPGDPSIPSDLRRPVTTLTAESVAARARHNMECRMHERTNRELQHLRVSMKELRDSVAPLSLASHRGQDLQRYIFTHLPPAPPATCSSGKAAGVAIHDSDEDVAAADAEARIKAVGETIRVLQEQVAAAQQAVKDARELTAKAERIAKRERKAAFDAHLRFDHRNVEVASAAVQAGPPLSNVRSPQRAC